MPKSLVSLIPCLLLANNVWAGPINHMSNTSLYTAINESVLANAPPNQTSGVAKPTTHESQKNNSLFHAVLAIQGVKTNIVIDANSKVDYSLHKYTDQQNNSLFLGALAK